MPRVTGRTGKFFGQLPNTNRRDYLQLTAGGDAKTYSSSDTLWANLASKFPQVRPNGVISDLGVNPTAVDDQVAVDALTVYLAGAIVNVGAGNLTVARPAADSKVSSVTVDSAGTLVMVAGTDGVLTTTRGVAGGPPLIPVGSVLLADVTFTATASAPVDPSEIELGVAERGDSPGHTIQFLDGSVVFNYANQLYHTASTPKQVYAAYHYVTLVQLGEFRQANISIGVDRSETAAAGDRFKDALDNLAGWSGSAEFYFDDPYFLDHILTNGGGDFIMEWQHHEDARFKLRGRMSFDVELTSPIDGPAMQTLPFTGKGEPIKIPIA